MRLLDDRATVGCAGVVTLLLQDRDCKCSNGRSQCAGCSANGTLVFEGEALRNQSSTSRLDREGKVFMRQPAVVAGTRVKSRCLCILADALIVLKESDSGGNS